MESHFLQQRFDLECNTSHIFPRHSGSGIQIDAQLIGVIKITCPNRMRMKLNASEVHNPGKPGGIIHDDLFCLAPGWKRKGDRPKPVGALGWCTLLIKSFFFSAIYEALEHDGTIADSEDSARRY